MPEWPLLTLDLLGTVERGRSRHRPRNDPVLYGGDYPFFQTGDVKAAEFHLREHTQTYNEAGLAQSRLWGAGTLCITIAANIAESAVLAIPGCFPDSVAGFTPTAGASDVRFVKYLLDHTKLRMQAISRGTTQDNLSLDKLLSLRLPVPDVAAQRKIAAVLAAYDELIENNLRRIEILEEMSQAVYREWFVNFRFPGHEDVPLRDSSLGPLPEGFVAAPLESALTFNSGAPIKANDRLGGEVPVYGANGVIGHTALEPLTPDASIALGKIGSCGALHRLREPAWVTNNTFWISTGMVGSIELAWQVLRAIDFSRFIGGSANPYMPLKNFGHEHIVVPRPSSQVQFGEVVRPMSALQGALIRQNANLRETRDLLLPRLVSGEIDVSDLDIDTEWLAS